MNCEYCSTKFTVKCNLDKHKRTNKNCKIIQLENRIKQLENENESLQTALEKAKSEAKTTIINNNTTNNVVLNVINVKQIEKRLLKMMKEQTYKE